MEITPGDESGRQSPLVPFIGTPWYQSESAFPSEDFRRSVIFPVKDFGSSHPGAIGSLFTVQKFQEELQPGSIPAPGQAANRSPARLGGCVQPFAQGISDCT